MTIEVVQLSHLDPGDLKTPRFSCQSHASWGMPSSISHRSRYSWIGVERQSIDPFAAKRFIDAGSRYRSMISSHRARIALISSRRTYASFAMTSVRFTFAAAIVSGFPLNVPTWSSSPAMIMVIASSVPPIAPHGIPAPSDFASAMRSGTTPKASTAPPHATVKPVFTSSKARSAPCV